MDIEFHHIETSIPRMDQNCEDNAIPVCYRCHADLERSKSSSARGSSYNVAEIKARRDQVYEEHTRHLVPPINYFPFSPPDETDRIRRFQLVCFHMNNPVGGLPVEVLLNVSLFLGSQFYGQPVRHYSGDILWFANPGITLRGSFDLANSQSLDVSPLYSGRPVESMRRGRVRLTIDAMVFDVLGYPHERLPMDWYYDWSQMTWILDP